MIRITQETVVDVDADAVFGFLSHIDALYKIWHPRDHKFCKVISGHLGTKGCVFQFLEVLGGFPLYSVVRVTAAEKDRYIEYRPVFPFSLLRTGWGYFKIEPIAPHRSKFISFVEYGYKPAWTDKVLDKIVNTDAVRTHIREEGGYMKEYLEECSNLDS